MGKGGDEARGEDEDGRGTGRRSGRRRVSTWESMVLFFLLMLCISCLLFLGVEGTCHGEED